MGLMKKLTSAIVASSLVFTLVGSASAAYTAETGTAAATRMQALKIVQGMPDGTLGLDQEITRAQLVTIIVRAFGQEENAKLLQGSAAGFTDTANHWASGNIAMAKALVEKVGGDAMGFADGSFQPEGKLTPAQAVAFLMKFLGVKADPAKAWPANYLDKAADMGLIAADDKAAIAGQANTNATRGLAFYLFDRAFASYTLPSGKTFYTQYVDQTAPELTVKNEAVSTTMDASVTVTGTVTGASELYVGSTKVTPDASGNFSADVALGEVKADPYVITVTARDLAGNKTEKSIQVTRTVGTAAVIEASDITVAAGATADVAVTVKDAKGNVLAGQTATGTSTVGTFADGKFTAAKTVGTGKLTLTVGTLTKDVNVTITAGALAKVEGDKASVAPGKTVTLVAKDANGNVITGATFSQTSPKALLDATTGVFMASEAGTYTVKATKDGVTVEGTVGVYGDIDHFVVSAPATLIDNDATEATVTATAADEDGNAITSFDGNVTLDNTLVGCDDNVQKAVNGVATFTITSPGNLTDTEVTLKATAVVDTVTIKGSTSIQIVGQVPTAIKLTAPAYIASNTVTATPITVKVMDQAGEEMLSGAWDYTVNVTGPASLSDTTDEKTGDVNIAQGETFDLYPTAAGDTGNATVSVSYAGLTAATANIKVAYAQADDAVKVTAAQDAVTTVVEDSTGAQGVGDNYLQYKVEVVDKNGVPTAAEPATLVASFTGVDEDTLTFIQWYNGKTLNTWTNPTPISTAHATDVVFHDGVAKFRVSGQYADSFSFKVKDSASNGLTASASSDVTVTAGAPKYVGISGSTVNVLVTNPTVNVTAQAYDEYGNKAAKSGVIVTFKDNAGDYDGIKINDKADDVDVATDATGAAVATVSLESYLSTAQIDIVAVDGTKDLDEGFSGLVAIPTTTRYASKIINTVTLLPKTVTADIVTDANGDIDTYDVGVTTPTGQADQARASAYTVGAAGFHLKATVKDNFDRAFSGVSQGLTPAFKFSVTDSSDDYSVPTLTWHEVAAGVYETVEALQPTKAETVTFTISLTAVPTTVSSTKSISVKAGTVAAVQVAEASSNDDMTATAASGTLTFAKDKLSTYTVQLLDANGNVATSNSANYAVTLTADAGITSPDYLNFRDSSNRPVEVINLGKGRIQNSFQVITNLTGASFTVELFVDANNNGVQDAGEATVFTYSVN